MVRVLPELKYDSVYKKLTRRGSFVYLKRNLTPSQQYQINYLGIPGLEFENGYPGIGTQWHPENLSKRREDMQSLFNWLVAKAAERA